MAFRYFSSSLLYKIEYILDIKLLLYKLTKFLYASPSLKMTDSTNNGFENRHKTMRAGFKYPEGYEPYDMFNGLISFWLPPSGLSRFSDPKNVTACYVACSTGKSYKESFDDPKYYTYSWPRPDKDYEQFFKS